MMEQKVSRSMDITEVARSRLLGLLRAAAPASAQCVLLCDGQTLRVLSHAVRMSELLEAAPQIMLVDSLHSPIETRTPSALAAGMDVIYFLSPTLSSVEAALADHEDAAGPLDNPTYGGLVHFVFSRRLPDTLLQRLRESASARRIATLREAHLQYLPLPGAAFSLDAPGAFGALFGPSGDASRAAALGALAEQVCTVYGSLGLPAPRVRYALHGHPVSRTFAEHVDALLRLQPSRVRRESRADGVVSGGSPRRVALRRSTLLILDRSFDPLTPLLHDFSFEALAEGLGLLSKGRYVRPAGKGEALLRESDAVWSDLRRAYLPLDVVPVSIAL